MQWFPDIATLGGTLGWVFAVLVVIAFYATSKLVTFIQSRLMTALKSLEQTVNDLQILKEHVKKTSYNPDDPHRLLTRADVMQAVKIMRQEVNEGIQDLDTDVSYLCTGKECGAIAHIHTVVETAMKDIKELVSTFNEGARESRETTQILIKEIRDNQYTFLNTFAKEALYALKTVPENSKRSANPK